MRQELNKIIEQMRVVWGPLRHIRKRLGFMGNSMDTRSVNPEMTALAIELKNRRSNKRA